MGAYSRKHMIEFAKFAKSFQSSRKVEEAYDAYLKGARLVTYDRTKTLLGLAHMARKIYLDGVLVKNRDISPRPERSIDIYDDRLSVKSWRPSRKVLYLTKL